MKTNQLALKLTSSAIMALIVSCSNVFVASAAFGAPTSQAQSESFESEEISQLVQDMQVMVMTKDAQIEMFDRVTGARLGKTLNLTAETEFTVVRKLQVPGVGELAEIMIDSDDETVPPEALVRMADLEQVAVPVNLGMTPLDANLSSEDDADDVLSQSVFRRDRRGGTPSCYRDVKFELLRRRLVHSYPPGAAAWMGFDVLRRFGFQPVAFSQGLPNGAVCVSEGGRFNCGRKKCGHIAVKIGHQRWYGAGVFPNPLLRGHYRLRCLLKH